MEVDRQKNSEDLVKTLEMLEEWKKLWKNKIIFGRRKKIYFLTLNYFLFPKLLSFLQHFQSLAGLLNSLPNFFHSSKYFGK